MKEHGAGRKGGAGEDPGPGHLASFGDLLRGFRRRSGQRQVDLGRSVYLDHSTISRLESGDRLPTVAELDRLAVALRLTEDERTHLRTAFERGVRDHYGVQSDVLLNSDECVIIAQGQLAEARQCRLLGNPQVAAAVAGRTMSWLRLMARRSSSQAARDALLRVAGEAVVEECKSYLDYLLPADAHGRLPSHDREEVSTTLRRDFLAMSGYAAAGHVLGLLEGPLGMLNVRLDKASTNDERIAHIENIAADLGLQVVRVEPTAVMRPALTTLHTVRTLLEQRHPARQQVRLVQASARLSTVIGEVLFNVGHFPRAREWYKAAEQSARDVGDEYLADIALAGQAYLPLYSDDPRGVLALLSPRLEGKTGPSPAIAWLWGFTARAHAALDDRDEFRRSIERAGECLARSPAELIRPGIFSFLPEKLGFYEATGAVRLKDPARAIDAADRALSLYDLSETMEPALVRLERASALAEAGEIPEACRAAKAALLEPHTYHGVTVRKYAGRFDGLISGIELPETRDWFEVRAAVHGRQDGLAS